MDFLTNQQRLEVIRLMSQGYYHDAHRVLTDALFPKPALPPVDEAELLLFRNGHKVRAIVCYRDRVLKQFMFTPGLKDAKDMVEAAAR